MKNLILYFTAIIIVMFAACNKSPLQQPLPEPVSTSPRITLSLVPTSPASNPQNPYDYLGYYHNIILDSLRHYIKSTGDTSKANRHNYLQVYMHKHFDAEIKWQLTDAQEKLACTNYKAVMLRQNASPRAQACFQSLSDALQSIRDLDHYEDYKNKIVAIEDKIITAKLPVNETKNLLMTASILRYSGFYWINAFKNGDITEHNSGKNAVSTNSLIRKIAGAITGIAADASVLAFSYLWADPTMFETVADASEICGYYTGWW